ncbi:HEPN/Toprim-associated domain-containing protein [Yersinia enterocolitica]|nr:hypothetical protein [Yersinia enterocolitica]EKN5118387.1 hypothetical protein [Yersinia enterocolitica]
MGTIISLIVSDIDLGSRKNGMDIDHGALFQEDDHVVLTGTKKNSQMRANPVMNGLSDTPLCVRHWRQFRIELNSNMP